LEEVSRRAEASSLAAQNAVETTASRHDDLVAQLADLRNTTVEMEQERQEALEAERQERENAAAAEALGAQHHQAPESEEQSDSSDSRSEQTPSRSHTRSEPEQEATQESGSSGEQGGSQGDSGSGSGGSSQSASDEGSSGSSSSDSSSSGSSSGGSNSGGSSNSGSSSSGSSGSGSSGGGGGSTAPSSVGQAALNWAMPRRGKPYVWGADGPDSYDCSGLTMRAFQHAGASLPRTTGAQYAATTHVPVDQMRPGDLIFYSSNGSASGIYHVALYAGDGMRVHAPAPGQSVEYVPVWWTNVLPYAGGVWARPAPRARPARRARPPRWGHAGPWAYPDPRVDPNGSLGRGNRPRLSHSGQLARATRGKRAKRMRALGSVVGAGSWAQAQRSVAPARMRVPARSPIRDAAPQHQRARAGALGTPAELSTRCAAAGGCSRSPRRG